MSAFEQEWHDRYMSNMVTVATLEKLVAAERLTQEMLELWVEERKEKYGV